MALSSRRFMNPGSRSLGTESFRHHASSADLVASADIGCHLCSLLVHLSANQSYCQTPPSPVTLQTITHPREEILWDPDDPEDLFHLQYEDTARAYGPNQSALYVRSARRQWPISLSAPSYLTNLHLSDTGASEMTSLVRSWYQKCCDVHTNCSQTANPRILPTRLVHVIEEPLHLQIIETSRLPRDIKYVALSYIWGPRARNETILTGEKSLRHQEHLEFSSLPATIQDGVVLTIRLGFQYLWVDRLCIDHSSVADFET